MSENSRKHYLLRLRRHLLRSSLRLRRRTGFSLIEASFAVVISVWFLVGVTGTIATAMQHQLEADRYIMAVALTEAKLSQLRNSPSLRPGHQEGTIEDAGLFTGLHWDLRVVDDKINLTEVQQTGRMHAPDVDDQLPDAVQNREQEESLGGRSGGLTTLGDLEVTRIIITISFPEELGLRPFRVETLQDKPRTSDASSLEGGSSGGF